jgi:asparagine synthase (glutamine-hydrolysing)
LSRLYPYVGQGTARHNRQWQEFFRRGLEDVDHPFYSHMIRWQNTGWALRLLAPELREDTDLEQMAAGTAASMPRGWSEWTPLARAQMIEIETFLSSYLLCNQGDRVAMGHSVETRYPFLDPDVVDFCNRLPSRLKLRGLRDKIVLRRLASRFLPVEIHERPKQPYRAPMTAPLFGPGEPDYVRELLSESVLGRYGLVNASAASKLVARARRQEGTMSGEREEMALVGLVTLQLLAHFFVSEFADRVAAARKRLERHRLRVLEDHADRRENDIVRKRGCP